MKTETKQRVARCPHCGHDEFRVNQSEIKEIRLVGTDEPPYFKEETLSTDGKAYPVVTCCGCRCDLNENEWMDSVAPAEMRCFP